MRRMVRSKIGLVILFIISFIVSFQNCSKMDFTVAQKTSSASSAPVDRSCNDPNQHRIISNNNECICDFKNGYYEVDGTCILNAAINDLCTPQPPSCSGVSFPQPIAIFDFNNSSVSNGIVYFNSNPGFSLIGAGSPSIASEMVCNRTRQVFRFQAGLGLKQIATSALVQNYTVAVLSRFNYGSASCSARWARIFDNKNNTSDHGLYMYGTSMNGASGEGRSLQFFSFDPGVTRSSTNEYSWVVFSKQNQILQGFVNRQLQWNYNDSEGWSDLTSYKDMIFFKDDTVVPNEECEGAVAKIIVFNSGLSKQQSECLQF